jgi:hypothetical protein
VTQRRVEGAGEVWSERAAASGTGLIVPATGADPIPCEAGKGEGATCACDAAPDAPLTVLCQVEGAGKVVTCACNVAAAASQPRIAPAERILIGLLQLIKLLIAGVITATIGRCRNATEVYEEITEGQETQAAGFLDRSSYPESPLQPADLSQLARLRRRGYDADKPIAVDQLGHLL